MVFVRYLHERYLVSEYYGTSDQDSKVAEE
jgi:hypothetical protein